jgi:hypothetical protein
MKNEFAKWLIEMQDSLNSKVDMEALSNLENMLMERIIEIVKALTKQLADKNDTKKALKLLERQLKNLYDLFISRAGDNLMRMKTTQCSPKNPLVECLVPLVKKI